MDKGVNIPVVATVSTPGAEQSANSLKKVNLVAKDTAATFYKLSNQADSTGSKKLVNLLNQLESKKSVITRIMNNDTNFNASTQAMKKNGVFDILPTSAKGTLQEYSDLEKLVHRKRKPEKLIEGLDKTIAQVKEIAGLTEDVVNKTEKIEENAEDVGNKTDENTKKQKEFNDAVKNSATAADLLKKGFNGLEIVKLTYLFRSIRRVSSAWVTMVENAANYEESINLYMMSFGKYSAQATKWMNRITDALKLDPSDVMQYAGAFNNLLKGMGVASEEAYIMSTNLTQLTYDMASYLNISNEAAQAKLQSAMAGQSRAVASVGVATQMASLQELAHSLNIKKKVANMTQAEKTYLRYIQLMRSTTHMQGDLGKTMLTPANAIRTLKNQINLLSRAIGQVLTPIIMQVIPYIMAMTNVLTELSHKIAEFFGYKITDVDYTTTFEDIGDALDGLGKDADDSGKKIRNSLAPFDELNQVMFESNRKGDGDDEGSVIPDLKKYVTGYDMLSRYTGDLVKRAEELKKPAETILGIIGALVGSSFLGSLIVKIATIKEAVKQLGIVNAISGLSSALGGLWGILGGIVLPITNMILGFTTIEDVSYNLTKSMGYMTDEAKSAVGIFTGWTGLVQLLTTAGATLVNPLLGIATALGFIVTDIKAVDAGKTRAIEEFVGKLRDAAKEKVFGTLSVSVEEWTSAFELAGGSAQEFTNRMNDVHNSLEVSFADFKTASDDVELLQLTFRATGKKISKEDAKKIKDSVTDMCETTKKMIDTNANAALLNFGDTFKNTTQWTKEEQDKILGHIKSYGEKQKKELDDAQKNITTTYDNAIKKRGYLTDEEYAYIEEQLAKIRQLTENQMTENNATVLRLKDSFVNDSKRLDEQSYKDFNAALQGYHDERKKALDEQYTAELNKLKGLYDAQEIDYDEYLASKKKLDDGYLQQEDALNNEIYGYRQEVYDNLIDMYNQVRDKNDVESLAMKEAIENILVDAKIDPQSVEKFTGQYQDVGKKAVFNLESGVKAEMEVKSKSIWEKIRDKIMFWSKKEPLKLEYDAEGRLILGFSGGGRQFATGGYPSSGDYFYMNENGRAEYMASIGNRTAVVNQDQMVQSLAMVITNAMANMGFGNNQKGDTIVYIGNKKVYEGQGEYQNRENDRYGTSVVRV